MNWFEAITGFPESTYTATKQRLKVEDGKLVGLGGTRRFSVGRLEIPSLAELRERTAGIRGGDRSKVSIVQGNARSLHADPANRGCVFQVASQFNLLEMVHYRVSPEDGVSRYETDRTQGPVCAIAAGAGTIFRNYLVPFPDGSTGQTRERQIDCLADLGLMLGNSDGELWAMKNGYALFTEAGLEQVNQFLENAYEPERASLRAALRIGTHWDVDVTDCEPGHAVSQVYCSALPVAYNHLSVSSKTWQRFATLVLEGAYEATLHAAVVNRSSSRSNVVYLTRLGGGAFGNDLRWIHAAMSRAFTLAREWGLDIRILTLAKPDRELVDLVEGYT